MSGDPFPKERQLARGQRRYRRKVASPKQWQAIQAAKMGACRVCGVTPAQLHHIVPRDLGGDDVAENIAPLCAFCHSSVTSRRQPRTRAFCASLTDTEYAYAVERGGEQVFESVYGIEYTR